METSAQVGRGERRRKGSLTIFAGYFSGTGKTIGIHVDVAQVVEREQVLSLHVDADVLDAGFRSPGFGQRVTDLDVLQADVRSVVALEIFSERL